MTLGKKLSRLRALADLTQGQLGEKLSVSPQAISKWENDLAEPDLATLRKLAELYQVSLDELLNLEEEEKAPEVQETEEKAEAPTEAPAEASVEETPAPAPVATPIGFCKDCGVTVTEENLGQKSPVVLCKKCVEARKAAAAREEAAQRQREAEAQRAEAARKASNRERVNKRRAWSYSVAGIVTVAFLALMISIMMNGFSMVLLAVTLVGGYMVFSFVHCLFYDCVVQDVVADWFTKSLELPGLIFTFDVDGCLWLVGMKILFFFLKVLFGLATGLVGIICGLVCAPFVFPYVVVKLHRDVVAGKESDLL